MPEAFAILFVFVVAVAAYVSARVQAANPANHNPAAELRRLKLYRASLEERLQQAWRENWDQEMLARINDEIESTEAQLAKGVTALENKP